MEKRIETVGQRLDWLRQFLNLSWTTFAAGIDVSSQKMSNWKRGDNGLPVSNAVQICEVYGVSLDFIYRGRADLLPQDMREAWLNRNN